MTLTQVLPNALQNAAQKICLLLALSMPLMAQAAPQSQASSDAVLSDDEVAMAEFCDFATYGVISIAVARQSDVPKSEVIAGHNQSMTTLKGGMDAFTLSTLDQYWKSAIERLYQEPILATDAQKQDFVMAVGESSYYHCLNELLKQLNS